MAEIIAPVAADLAVRGGKAVLDYVTGSGKQQKQNKQQQQQKKNNNPRGRGRGRGGRGGRQPNSNRSLVNEMRSVVQQTVSSAMKGQQRKGPDTISAAPAKFNVTSRSYHNHVPMKRPHAHMYDRSTTCEGEFNIGTINTAGSIVTAGEDIFTLILNPKYFKGSRLAFDAQVWQRYHFEYIELKYFPMVGSTTPGMIALAVLDNIALPIPEKGAQSVVALSNLRSTIETSVTAPAICRHMFHTPTQPLLCTQNISSDLLGTLSNQAKIIVKSVSTMAPNLDYGVLKMKYRVHFYEEIYPVDQPLFSMRETFELATYVSNSVYYWYIKKRSAPDSFPVDKNNSTVYNVIAMESFSFHIHDGSTFNVTPGMSFYGVQKPGDDNISYLYVSYADMITGPTAAIRCSTTEGPFSFVWNIIQMAPTDPDTVLLPSVHHGFSIPATVSGPIAHEELVLYQKYLRGLELDKQLLQAFRKTEPYLTWKESYLADVSEEPQKEQHKKANSVGFLNL